jgi:hypothetical protein
MFPKKSTGERKAHKDNMQFLKQARPSSSPERPEIEYPCTWAYKVIGEDRAVLIDIIIEACSPHVVAISHSHASRQGKYHSVNAELVIPDATTRLRIYEILKSNAAVKIVL